MKRVIFANQIGILGSQELYRDLSPVDKKLLPKTDVSDKDNVFGMIYAPDPLTGRPRSDLGTYLSENTNPLVRDFIERQLRTDFSQYNQNVPADIDEGTIALLTRDRTETVEEYVGRVNSYADLNKRIYQKNVYLRNQKRKAEERARQKEEFEKLKNQ